MAKIPLITGHSPYPAPPPDPLPADDVDVELVAFAVCELLSDNFYGLPPLRSSAAAGPARLAAEKAELLGMRQRPDGDAPEVRKRARDVAGAVAPYITLLLGDELGRGPGDQTGAVVGDGRLPARGQVIDNQVLVADV